MCSRIYILSHNYNEGMDFGFNIIFIYSPTVPFLYFATTVYTELHINAKHADLNVIYNVI